MSRPKLSDEDVSASLRWFARQAEGRPFFAFLTAELLSIGPLDTCALQRHDERRRFAADLIEASAMEGSDGPDQGTGKERRNASPVEPRKSRRHGPAGR